MRRIASARKLFKKPARIRYVVGERFRDMRLTCGLSLDACAKLLRVSVRTVRYWEADRNRIPYAAVGVF